MADIRYKDIYKMDQLFRDKMYSVFSWAQENC